MTDVLKEFIFNTIKSIIDSPDDLIVTVPISTKSVIIQIYVNQADCGKIIGKKGRTIEALKILCLAIKNTNFPEDSRHILLEIMEDENSKFVYQPKV